MASTRRADMFTEDGRPSADDPREHRARLGDERTTLSEELRCQRLTLEMKCAGLDAEQMARRAVEPSTMSLLGLVRHLAEGERAGFRRLMAGQDVPRLYCSETNPDGDFDDAVADPQLVDEAWRSWRAEVEFATEFVANAPGLDITADDSLNQHGSGGGAMSLRELLVGMIGEYAGTWGTPTCSASESTDGSASSRRRCPRSIHSGVCSPDLHPSTPMVGACARCVS